MSCILLTTCLENVYFVNRYTGEHFWKKHNDTYDSKESLKINNTLLELKSILKNNYEKFDKMSKKEKYYYLL